MSLYKRKGSPIYWAGFTLNGKRIQKSCGTADKLKAQEYHDRLKAELWNQVKLGTRPDPLWDEIVMRWLEEKEHKRSLQDDLIKIRWLDKWLGGKRLSEIDSHLIERIKAAKKREKHVNNRTPDKTASKATVNRYLALISGVLHFARDREYLLAVPKIHFYREPTRRVRWLTVDEVNRLLRCLPEHIAEMVRFSLSTGLRRQNVVNLRWSQLDMQNRVAWFTSDEIKTAEPLMIPLNDEALSVIRRQLGQHQEFVFNNLDGKHIRFVNKSQWAKALEDAGIEDFRWHDLRHTWASWHVQSGTSTFELQELGGWKRVETVRKYAHLSASRLHEAANRIVTKSLQSVRHLDEKQR